VDSGSTRRRRRRRRRREGASMGELGMDGEKGGREKISGEFSGRGGRGDKGGKGGGRTAVGAAVGADLEEGRGG
jgi:hypothetical protein